MEPLAMKDILKSLKRWLDAGHPNAGRRRLLAAIPAILLAWFLLGGQQGLFALAMSQREKARLREEIVQLTQDNARLEAQADALARNPQACEKTARERLLLMRPGETIYRFQ
jgi:cell division protein FtsB